MSRQIQDAALSKSSALPAAGAANATSSIDLGQVTVDCVNEVIEVSLNVPALPALADAKNATFTFKDSADNITFAAIAKLPTLTLGGAGGVGNAGLTRNLRLPDTTRRYLRADCVVDAAGGDSTAVSYTLALLF